MMPNPDPRPFHSLRHPDFRALWAAQAVSLTGTHMQVAALTWHVYLLTGSAFALGLIGLTRAAPILAFALASGLVADRWDRRRVMIVTRAGTMLVSAGLAWLAFAGSGAVWAVLLLNALTATANTFDNPSRQALIPRLVPRADLPGAVTLNLAVLHAGMIAGPALAGLLLAGAGGSWTALGWIYAINAAAALAVLVVLARMDPASGAVRDGAHREEHPIEALRSGLKFVFRTPLMVWTMTLDFLATFFCGAMALLPIFATDILGAGPLGYGLLFAAPAIGALAGSVGTSVTALPRRQGPVFLGSVAAFAAATVVFGLSRNLALTFAALALTGLADLVSTVIRQTLRQLITPDHLRGRMTSINMLFFMGGPQLGELEAGLVAALFASRATGATVSVVSGGLATLMIVALVAAFIPAIRGYDVSDHLDEAADSA